MADYKALISELTRIASTPDKSIAESMKETGKEAFGCFPLHTPEELVYAAGYLPVGLWGGKTDLKLSDKFLQGFCCTIIKANLEFGMNGTYKMLKGVIIPALCDTLKCVSENWIYACPDIPVIPIVYPMLRKIEGGEKYCVEEFRHVQKRLEEISGRAIPDKAIEAAFTVYEDIVKDIINEVKQLPKEKAQLRIIASGIVSEPVELLDILTENGIAIVGDDLSQESRNWRTPARKEGTALEKMAGMIADQKGDTFLYEQEKYKGAMLIDQVKNEAADGVIYFQMKFCDPEEFDYPIVKKELEAAGIPLLYIEVDQLLDSVEQLRTRIQSFAELLV